MGEKDDRHLQNVRTRYSADIRQLRVHTRELMTAEHTDQLGFAVAAFTAAYITQYGHGPSRREAAAATSLNNYVTAMPADMPARFTSSWQAEAVDVIFATLRHAGWVTFTRTPRSLRPAGHAGSPIAARRSLRIADHALAS